MTYCHTLAQEPQEGPEGLEIYNFGRPFLGHHYYILSLILFDPCPSREEDFLKK